MRVIRILAVWAVTHLLAGVAPAQIVLDADENARLGAASVMRYRVGMQVTAQGGPCAGLYGTVSVPNAWPEQHLKLVDEEFSVSVSRVEYRELDSGVRQMMILVPRLGAGEMANATITLEITRRAILPPDDPDLFVIPKRLPRELRGYLADSPLIEIRNSKVRGLARELARDDLDGWELVESMYDGVRERVQYREGSVQGAAAALDEGQGNHEDLTSLFIALCRANKVPARTVWVPDFCYAEFYLEDEEGQGHWFPCQLVGSEKQFGGIQETRPILQKGDNIRVPEKKEPQRFVAEYLKGKAGAGLGRPAVTFIRQVLPAQ